MSSANRSYLKIAAAVCLALGLLWLGVVGVLWQQTTDVAPTFHVRWASRATTQARIQAEAELRLVRPEQLSERTWAYDMLDSTPAGIERIVKHPLVEDTQDIDRKNFTLSPGAQSGKTERWIGDRLPVLDSRERVSMLSWVAGGLVLLGAAGLWLSRLASKSSRP